MGESAPVPPAPDPDPLDRFVTAQAQTYAQALSEIRAGRKRSHWMWYIFPQLAGLGSSPTSRFYAIKDLAEARAYLAHPVLGPRLHQCAQAMLQLDAPSATDVLGSPDDLKLRSCATLFDLVTPRPSVFEQLLQKYFEGVPDPRTLQLRSD